MLVEGMLISAFALKAYRGYIFLRGEYIEAAQHLRRAIAEATEAGLLGKNILGTGFDFELFVHTGAGRYICGEETALINSPGRPPRQPAIQAAVPGELRRLGQADLRQQRRNPVQRASDPRQRRRVVPEHFHQQRCWHQADGLLRPGKESGRLGAAVSGTTAREILEDYAGGMRDGLKFKAWQPGGAGTDFLTEAHLDLPMEFESIGKAGSRLGHLAGDGR